MTENNIAVAKRKVAYPKLKVRWARIEVPMDCYTELPPNVLQKGSALMDPQSVYWVVRYIFIVAKTAAFILSHAYKNCRFWRLSRQIIKYYWDLYLKPVTGSDWNFEQIEYILGMIEETDFKRLPQRWGSRSKQRGESNLSGRGSVPIGFTTTHIRVKRSQSATSRF